MTCWWHHNKCSAMSTLYLMMGFRKTDHTFWVVSGLKLSHFMTLTLSPPFLWHAWIRWTATSKHSVAGAGHRTKDKGHITHQSLSSQGPGQSFTPVTGFNLSTWCLAAPHHLRWGPAPSRGVTLPTTDRTRSENTSAARIPGLPTHPA